MLGQAKCIMQILLIVLPSSRKFDILTVISYSNMSYDMDTNGGYSAIRIHVAPLPAGWKHNM